MITLLLDRIPKVVKIILIVLLLVFLGTFVATPAGQHLLSSLMEDFPFFNFVYSTYNKIMGYNNDLPDMSSDYFVSELIKLIVISLVSALVFALLTRIFNNVHAPVNQILDNGRSYEYIEMKMQTPSFEIKKAIISIFSEYAGVYVGGLVIKIITSVTSKIDDPFKRAVVNILLLVLFYLGYSIIHAVFAQKTISFAIFKTFIYNVLPEVISTFVTTSLMLLVYFNAKEEGFNLITILFIVALFIWCALSNLICSELKVYLIQQSSGQKSRFDIANCFAATTFYLCAFVFYFFGHVMAGEEGYFESEISKMLFAYNELPFFQLIKENGNLLDMVEYDSFALFAEIPKLIIFVILVSLFQKLVKGQTGVSRYIADCFTLVGVILSYSLVLYAFNNVQIFPVIVIGVIIILMLTKKFYSLVNFIEYLISSILITALAVFTSTFFTLSTDSITPMCFIALVSMVIWYVSKKFAL